MYSTKEGNLLEEEGERIALLILFVDLRASSWEPLEIFARSFIINAFNTSYLVFLFFFFLFHVQRNKMSTKLNDLGETNNNNISDLTYDGNKRRGTPIQEFYAGQKILITGISLR